MLPIEEIESGLLPTPLAQAMEQTNFEAYDARMERLVKKGHKPFTMPLDQMALRGMLPTPTAIDSTNSTVTRKSTQVKEGSMHSVTLSRYILKNPLLNTPTASDKNGGCTRINQKLQLGTSLVNEMHGVLNQPNGKTSQLNPQFVLEMMGFPTDWTELPFLNGEANQSKQQETQLSHK
jgi:hypothetical protein